MIVLSTWANPEILSSIIDSAPQSFVTVCSQGARKQAYAYAHSQKLPGRNCSSITWLSKKEEPYFCYHVMIRCELETPQRIDHDFSICYFWQESQHLCRETHFEYQGEFRYLPPEEEEDPHSPDYIRCP